MRNTSTRSPNSLRYRLGKAYTILRLIRSIINWPLFLYDYWYTDRQTSHPLFRYRFWNGHTITCRAFTYDKWTIPEAYMQSDYWHKDFRSFSATPTIIDIGAHIGCFSLSSIERYPNARIIAIEASPETFALLQQNINDNHYVDRIYPVHAAVTAHDGMIEFYNDPRRAVCNSILQTGGNKEGAVISVEGMSMESICQRYHIDTIDLLKCDIEGGEFSIFPTLPASVYARVNNIAMEYHLFRPEFKVDALITLFQSHGLTLLERTTINDEVGIIKFRRD